MPEPNPAGKGPSHQADSLRRSLPVSCARSSLRLASAMSAPGDSAGVVFRPAEGATRRAVSSVPLTMMKGVLDGDAGRGDPRRQRRPRRSTAGSAADASAFTQNVRTAAQSRIPTATR